MSAKVLLATACTLLSAGLIVDGSGLRAAETAGKVTLLRVPQQGIQPQAAVDAQGTVHLICFRGDPHCGDLFYVHSRDGATFSKPIQVNSRPGSAIAAGNIRGAHLAVGQGG